MAEILSFTGRLNPEGAARLSAALTQAFADGADLGRREPQIRALGLSLGSLVDTLRFELDRLDVCLADSQLPSSGHPECRALLAEFERFGELARAYRAADASDAVDCPGL
ncbi:hypothetical protein MKK70_03330 [Methylobacterium sp. E-041]|uniref:hypothetical protein n=1 Tax=Methylobacterium sp. E-041 TaxID=2836573 RepID=UPI001FBAD3CF|nr:hypothetical protein [Methylobacterium sp. E-041]MCJ2104433.1 hypothetical protein [Methylobacterium sp. E-041]